MFSMELSQYLAEIGLTESQFAELIGSTQQSVNRYKNRIRIPLPKMMSRIHRATNGRVSAADFYALDESKDELCAVDDGGSMR